MRNAVCHVRKDGSRGFKKGLLPLLLQHIASGQGQVALNGGEKMASLTGTTSAQHAGLAFETELWQAGFCRVAGADEAGRGAWAGPVVAAAVILPPDVGALAALLGQVNDSKKLSPLARERVFGCIEAGALTVGVGSASAEEIDRFGIAPANRLALERAVLGLAVSPDFLLLDFFTLPGLALPQRGMPHGDALSLSIAAASIIVEVTRDRWMAAQDAIYPGYSFVRHKGYGTAAHRDALDRLGPCAIHRHSFAPIVQCQLFSRSGQA